MKNEQLFLWKKSEMNENTHKTKKQREKFV